MGEGSDVRDRSEGGVPPDGLRLVQAVAEALRAEFGVGIDAHPGGPGNEAGAVNRAFRAMVRAIFRPFATPGDDHPAMMARALKRAALDHLIESGVPIGRAGAILDSEPGLGDAWLAYLALAPTPAIEEIERLK